MKNPWYFPGSYWFPVAALYAAIALPWSVLGQLGLLPAPQALQTGLDHAHEMIFGYALAVVAGYTLVPGSGKKSFVLLGVWLAARLAFLLAPLGSLAFVLDALFVLGLAGLVTPIYLRASKWSNRSVGLIIGALAAAALAFHALPPLAVHQAVRAAVLLLSMLMFFMGGRILAPAVAGHLRAKGAPIEHVVQPGLEVAVLALLAAGIVCLLLPWPWAARAGVVALLTAALLTLVRMVRWHFWLCHDKPDLVALLAGYFWLIAGWVLVAWAVLAGHAVSTALHAITVGALGTLTFGVMLRTQMFRATSDTNHLPWAYAAVALLTLAALLRLGASANGALLALAAACWALAYALLFTLLLWLIRRSFGSAGDSGPGRAVRASYRRTRQDGQPPSGA
ncbi:MAG: hypothetical protein ABS45_11405 [Comamonas sp. SCN 65-56]|uniref:NnrS family protein n=1 Tax=Comamonas sp. SCN 65-56 TaxID=1660095 RepID=UPI00086F46B6|nr:NnrS family protein [Comamonas sp. SCN 65-56]ODS91401.1 MAG: hypothetical protein ABS45_11405 [Comamonas sp. SCN 65-56]